MLLSTRLRRHEFRCLATQVRGLGETGYEMRVKTTVWFAILAFTVCAGCTPAQQRQTQAGAQQATQVGRKDAAVAAKDASNAALAVRVSAAIAAETGVNAFHVKSSANNGIVTLTGTAPNARIDRTILDTAQAVPGVKRIVDRITVR